jgi:hypothetical protein
LWAARSRAPYGSAKAIEARASALAHKTEIQLQGWRQAAPFSAPIFRVDYGKSGSDSARPFSSAGVAQLVEHHLAKVDVDSSNLFARSIFQNPRPRVAGFLF